MDVAEEAVLDKGFAATPIEELITAVGITTQRRHATQENGGSEEPPF